MKAEGEFKVSLQPLEGYAEGDETTQLARLGIDKIFTGALAASSKGEMLSARAKVGSAGYVALERVDGSLDGNSGSFVLQHFGIMTPEAQRLILEVIPGTGTGQLGGISGTMTIEIVEGQHRYCFEYELPS